MKTGACLLVVLASCGGGNNGLPIGGDGSSSMSMTAEMKCVGIMQKVVILPAFDRSCREDPDCAIGMHQVSCCGTMAALGINKAQSAAFAAAEKPCADNYPGCGCATGPTQTDDGSTEPNFDSSKVKVACRAGVCTTYAGK